MARKILLVANTDWYLFNFRLSLARAINAHGWEPIFVCPAGRYFDRLVTAGFPALPIPITRRGIFPFQELLTVQRLSALYRQERPDLVHHHTIKPVIYGSLASRWAGNPCVVNSITGLGFVFLSSRFDARVLRPFIRSVYRYVLAGSQVNVVFENPGDRDYFLSRKLIRHKRHKLIEGVGVDLARFVPSDEPDGDPVVVLASRMLWDKGVREFVEAAAILRERRVKARFVLVGAPDPGNPATIQERAIRHWVEQRHIEWWGHRGDMPQVFASSHIVTLPSYAEGVPTVLLEATASGRPIVATDIPGCREIVRDGKTGFLVPVRDAESLATALETLIADRGLRNRMGEAGRELATSRFNQEDINRRTIQLYEEVLKTDHP